MVGDKGRKASGIEAKAGASGIGGGRKITKVRSRDAGCVRTIESVPDKALKGVIGLDDVRWKRVTFDGRTWRFPRLMTDHPVLVRNVFLTEGKHYDVLGYDDEGHVIMLELIGAACDRMIYALPVVMTSRTFMRGFLLGFSLGRKVGRSARA